MADRAHGTLLVVCLLFAPGPGHAQCTSTSDASIVLKSAKQAVTCNYKRLRRRTQSVLHPHTAAVLRWDARL